MGNLPLHPLLVHLPLALAVLLPPLVAVVLWSEWRRHSTTALWWVAALAAGVLTVGAFVSVRTGEREKERVERIVPEAALERHEERAELLQWATLAPLAVLVGGALAKRQTLRRYAGAAALAVSLLVAGMAIGVGDSGGRLVYEHNAGAAYGSGGAPNVPRAQDEEHERH